MRSPTITRPRTLDPLAPGADRGVDRERFAALYAHHRDELARYCRSILRHDQDVEDALQSTMVKAFAALRTETREIALRPWLFRIAHNEAISIVRRRVDAAELDDRDGGDPDPVPDAVETRERLRLLREDLGDLPQRQRSALVLRELSGLGHREIADVLGSSPSAVKQAIYEARCALGDCAAGRSLTCDGVRRALSDGDGRTAARRRLRAHLRSCRSCRAFDVALRQRPQDLGALFPAGPALGAGGAVAGLSGLVSGAGGGAVGAGSATVGVGATTAGVGATTGVGAVGSGGLLGGALAGAGVTKLAGIAAVAVIAGGGAVAVERGTFASSASEPESPSGVGREAPPTPGPALRFAAATGGSTANPVVTPLPGDRKPSGSTPAGPAPRRGDRAVDSSRDERGGRSDRSPAHGKTAAPGPAKRSAAADPSGRPARGTPANRGTTGRPTDAGLDRSAATKPARGPKPARAAVKRAPATVAGKPATPAGPGPGSASSVSSMSHAPANGAADGSAAEVPRRTAAPSAPTRSPANAPTENGAAPPTAGSPGGGERPPRD